MAIEFNDAQFDIEKAKKSIHIYSKSTGIESFIINAEGECLYESSNNNGLCKFCRKLQSLNSAKSSCTSVHLYGSYQAERFGGKYIFFCPIGFVHWASPITVNKSIQGAMVGGPVLMVDPDDFLLDDLIRKNGINDEQLMDLKRFINGVPVVQPETVNSLSELLYIVASGFSSKQTGIHDEQRQYLEQQADISETIHRIKLLEYSDNEKVDYPFEKEKELLSKIALGDKPSSQKILNEILGYVFFSSGRDFEVIKARVMELVVLLSRAAVEGGADSEQIFGLNYGYLSDINKFNTVEEITFWLSKIMARFTDFVFNLADIRHKDTIYKAVDYIKRNYMKTITLEDIANYVYLNPSYFSKIFKSEMKCTFVSYVNRIRISASKKLLPDASIPLTEVSTLVGFDDQSYFTKVFKKATGMTPGKYRESRGHSSGS